MKTMLSEEKTMLTSEIIHSTGSPIKCPAGPHEYISHFTMRTVDGKLLRVALGISHGKEATHAKPLSYEFIPCIMAWAGKEKPYTPQAAIALSKLVRGTLDTIMREKIKGLENDNR